MGKYQVWIENNLNHFDYDYDIVKNDGNLELTYSNSSDWNEEIRATICAILKDDGNGVNIKIGNKKISINYAELRELKCLLFFENNEHIEIREANTIKILK